MYPYNQPMQFQNYMANSNQQIIRVNGENGARAFQMMPNSSALLLDETDSRIFLAQTDGAGYKTISAYRIEPYKAPEQIDINELANRIKKLEERYEQSNTRNGSQAERNQQNVKKS